MTQNNIVLKKCFYIIAFACIVILGIGAFFISNAYSARAYSQTDSAYSYSIVSQNAYPTIKPGSSYNFILIVRNTGTQTWQKNKVNLGTSHPQDRISGFIRGGGNPSGWISQNRIQFQESSVAPGAIATYSFYMQAPTTMSAGSYQEYFQLVADGVEWMQDYGIYWNINVVTGASMYRYSVVSQNAYPNLYNNQSYNFILKVRNTGYTTWQKNKVNLGTSHPQDRVSVFTREGDGPSGWISQNRIQFQESSVAPGEIATYSFWMKNVNVTAGTYYEYFQLVAENVTWMTDYGIYWRVIAKDGPMPTYDLLSFYSDSQTGDALHQ